MFENTWTFCINPIWIGIWVATPIWLGGGQLWPTLLSAKMLRLGWNFPKSCKTKILRKAKKKLLGWRHFSSLQNILAKNRQKWIFLIKMLQMGWNFYTNSKIHKKTKKSAKKIDMTSLWRHFGQFLQKNWRHFFTADLAKNFEKIDVTLIFFSIFELQIFVYNFWPIISPIWPFLSNLWQFLWLICFVLEVPENQQFRRKKLTAAA